jgi:hypothetical protein
LGIAGHGQTIRVTNHDWRSPNTRSREKQAKKKKLTIAAPMTVSREMHGFGRKLPPIESSRDANGGGGWMSEFKTRRRQLKAGASDIVIVMFHNFGNSSEWWTLDLEECSIPTATLHPKAARALWGVTLWGVTLPNIYEFSPGGRG